jgi:ubiquinol-cytochrome c reductase cytochrome b subunit
MLKRVTTWLDSRIKLGGVRSRLLGEPIPGGASWVYVFGGVTLFFFVLLLITGIFLTIYYVPSPDHAYESIKAIDTAVPLGWFVRSLHHWAAGALIMVIGLHMLQVFLSGAYKPPRELLWVVGVAMLIVVLMFAFTGYLLPWDQKAYWATRVGTGKLASIPLIGEQLLLLARGDEEMGASTLSRFFSMHAVIFPWVIVLLIGLHLFILKQIGPAGPWDEIRAKRVSEPFYPRQVLKDSTAIVVSLLIVAGLAAALPYPLADEANPAATDFEPVPEWYFLFYYQLLKYLRGPILEPVGTMLVPVLLFVLLFALPFIDRRKERSPSKRPLVLAMGGGFLIVVFTLLGVSLKQIWSVPTTDPSVVAGKKVFAKYPCASCHQIQGEGGTFCPNLSHVASRRDRDWVVRHFKNPQAVTPGSPMPAFHFSEQELNDLTNYIMTLK